MNNLDRKKIIMAVGAHPDDLEFGCPVTVRNFIKQGYEAYYVILTNGENGFKEKARTKQERINTRRKEQQEAAKKIGVKKIYFFGNRDGFLEYNETLRKKLTLLIKALRPEIVFCFDPANRDFDNINLFHRDHRISAEAAFDAVFAAKNEFIYPHKNGLHKVEKIYFFGTNKPNYSVDISKDIDFKLDVLSSYESQFPNFENFTNFYKDFFRNQNPEYEFSEDFRVMDIIQFGF